MWEMVTSASNFRDGEKVTLIITAVTTSKLTSMGFTRF
jgi:hypothetical protein